MTTELRAGTSGFSYDEWRGSFYPDDLSADRMLGFYATVLPSVEINNTFYRMPKNSVLEEWKRAVPDSFRFVLKASRRITHLGRLRDVGDSVVYLLERAKVLEEKLGAILFQLPPFLKRDDALLGDFLALLPQGYFAAIEFRHDSWYDDATYSALSNKNVALCVGDAEDGDRSPPFVPTADWGYLRLRAADYTDAAIEAWAERIAAESWRATYAFFKHEQKGPALAKRLLELAGAPLGPGLAKAAARAEEPAPLAAASGAPAPAPSPAKKRTRRTPQK